MSMCNNDVTYHEKWDTLENNAALKKLDEKFFDRSICSPSCPVGWAPEVLELLERLDKEFGIARNTQTIRAYFVDKSLFELFIKRTFSETLYAFKLRERRGKVFSFKERVKRARVQAGESVTYARKVLMMRYVNGIINKVLRPKFQLSQIKEKYGYLTLYFHCEPEYKEYVEGLVREVTIKLATKGCYYPLDTLMKRVDKSESN